MHRAYWRTLAIPSSKTRRKPICGTCVLSLLLIRRILNSCTVKDPSETAFHNLVDEATRKGIKLVVAGCVPQGNDCTHPSFLADSDAPWLRSLSILGVKQVHRILEVVEETLKGNKIQLLSQRPHQRGLSRSLHLLQDALRPRHAGFVSSHSDSGASSAGDSCLAA